MHKSQELANLLIKQYNITEENAQFKIASMIENLVLTSINDYVTNKNLENFNKMNVRVVLPRKEIQGIDRVQVWPRRG